MIEKEINKKKQNEIVRFYLRCTYASNNIMLCCNMAVISLLRVIFIQNIICINIPSGNFYKQYRSIFREFKYLTQKIYFIYK